MLPTASLPAGAVVLFLDSPASLSRAEALLPKEGDGDEGDGEERILAVGIDAEWGPTAASSSEGEGGGDSEDEGRGRGSRRRRGGAGRKGKADAATLLQVAVRLLSPSATTARTLVLLFDLVSLDHEAAAPLLRRLLVAGGRETAVRLGWGLRGDLAALVAAGDKKREKTAASAAALSAAARVARPAVDLRGAVPHLLLQKRTGFSSPPPSHGFGLAAAVAVVLGLDLDKTHQRSRWGRRPLSEGQLGYAALDAAILLDLAEEAARRFLESEIEKPPAVSGGGEEEEPEDGEGEGEELGRLYSFLKERFARVITFDGSTCGVAAGEAGGGGSRRPRRQRARRKGRAQRTAAAATGATEGGEGEGEGDGDSFLPSLPPPWDSPSEARFLVDSNEGLARQLRLWGVDAASAPPPGAAAFAAAASGSAAAAAVAAPRSSPCSNRGRGARAAERAAALLHTAAAEGRVLLTGSRALLQLSFSLSSASAAANGAASRVHLLAAPSASASSSSSSAPSGGRKGKSGGAPPARELAASVLRHFGIRPGVGGDGNGNGTGTGDGGGGGEEKTQPSLLSRCSACNGDFLPSPYCRDTLPQLALDALSRGGRGKKKSGGGAGRGEGASSVASRAVPSEKETPSLPSLSPFPFPEDKELWVCSNSGCGKVYWNGRMYARAVERMTKRLEDGLLG